MKHLNPPTRACIVAALAVVLLTGCASEAAIAQRKKEKELVASGEYVWYTPVGTNLAVLVPKDVAKANKEEIEASERTFGQIQRATSQPETGPQSGIPGAQGGGGGGK